MSITKKRKILFSRELLLKTNSPIGFIDVGSGGALKYPWNILPPDRIDKFNFEPTNIDKNNELPLCISNQEGQGRFFIAKEERSSSLHEASSQYVQRFGDASINAVTSIDVRLSTLDKIFEGKYDKIDLIDINVEGHDFQVLGGADALLDSGNVKLLKIEFELTEVWKGQGWFSDIDAIMRNKGYDLADIEIEFGIPKNVNTIYLKGEPLWGKAYYVPSMGRWKSRLDNDPTGTFATEIMKAVVLYTNSDIPSRAIDLLDLVENKPEYAYLQVGKMKDKITWIFAHTMIDRIVPGLFDVTRILLKNIFK
jgi:FkbM family methyltransferase